MATGAEDQLPVYLASDARYAPTHLPASDEAVIGTINLLTSTERSIQCFETLRVIGRGLVRAHLLTPLDGGQL
jgi:hypothetical protein